MSEGRTQFSRLKLQQFLDPCATVKPARRQRTRAKSLTNAMERLLRAHADGDTMIKQTLDWGSQGASSGMSTHEMETPGNTDWSASGGEQEWRKNATQQVEEW